jgi:glycosyltransferase involved in cell wall biosynthesis
MTNKKVAIIGTDGVPSKYGGFETLVEYLTKNLAEKYDLTVFCSSKSYTKQLKSYNGAKLKYINFSANGLQSIPYDVISIVQSLKFADTLLILGVSGCIILPFVRLLSRKKIIVNIDGLEWKREKWGKVAKFFLKFSEKMAVNYADIVITDNQVITEYVLREYGKESTLIAYGGDHARRIPLSNDLLKRYSFLKEKYAFSVCRIEPENNIHIILKAMSLQHKLILVIIGNWNNSAYGKKLRKQYANFEHIHLLDPIYNQNLLDQIRSNCTVYLHGHSAGGTNPSLVEAMYLRLPIYAYDVLFNLETTSYKASYFRNAHELLKLVENISEDSLYENAANMYDLAMQRYKWKNITSKYAKLV